MDTTWIIALGIAGAGVVLFGIHRYRAWRTKQILIEEVHRKEAAELREKVMMHTKAAFEARQAKADELNNRYDEALKSGPKPVVNSFNDTNRDASSFWTTGALHAVSVSDDVPWSRPVVFDLPVGDTGTALPESPAFECLPSSSNGDTGSSGCEPGSFGGTGLDD